MKTAIVIGATSGIGRGITQLLVQQQYQVGIVGRRTTLLDELTNELGEHVAYCPLDITHPAAPERLSTLANTLGGEIDLIFFSSGWGEENPTLDLHIEARTAELNVAAFTTVCNWAWNQLLNQGAGQLVIVSSVASLRGSAGAPAYNATKAYQSNYAEALSIKAAKTKLPIFVTDIRPGFVDTDMAKGEGLFWVTPIEKACRQIYTAIQSKKRIAYISKRWGIIALLLRLLPYPLYRRL